MYGVRGLAPAPPDLTLTAPSRSMADNSIFALMPHSHPMIWEIIVEADRNKLSAPLLCIRSRMLTILRLREDLLQQIAMGAELQRIYATARILWRHALVVDRITEEVSR